MIDEIFLSSAVRIRRTYLKLSNNMDLYQRSASDIVKRLDETIKSIDDLQKRTEEAKKGKKPENTKQILVDMMKILNDIDLEGKGLDNLVNPLNKEIEKLAIEEKELYRQIKEKHHSLTEEQIINSVKKRLDSENI
jgi:hypothetical protein